MKQIISIDEKVDILLDAFAPSRDRYWTDRTDYENAPADLTIKIKKKISASQNRAGGYNRLENEDIKKHVDGTLPIVVNPKHKDGTAKFGAIDFDYPWSEEHVVAIYILAIEQGFHCPLFRSSRKGWHLYFFFNEPIACQLFVKFANVLIAQAKFDQLIGTEVNGVEFRKLELFPSGSPSGGGIKLPLDQKQVFRGFNSMYKVVNGQITEPIEDQWQELKNRYQISTQQLEDFIELNHTNETPLLAQKSMPRAPQKENEKNLNPLAIRERIGCIDNVLSNCAALNDASNAETPSHQQRLALGCMATNAQNGIDDLLNLVKKNPSWDIEKTKKHLDSLLEGNYVPMSCSTLQELGVCKQGKHPKFGDHCLPSRTDSSGKAISPSPSRFLQVKEDIVMQAQATLEPHIERMRVVAQKRLTVADPEYISSSVDLTDQLLEYYVKVESLANIATKSRLENYLDALPYVDKAKKRSLKKRAADLATATRRANLRKTKETIQILNGLYSTENNRYLRHRITTKGDAEETILSNFILEIDLETIHVNNLSEVGSSEQRQTVSGVVHTDFNKSYRFNEIPASDFLGNQMTLLFSRLSNIVGSSIVVEPKSINEVRNCIAEFNSPKHRKVRKIILVRQGGWNRDIYLVGNCRVSTEGVVFIDENDDRSRDQVFLDKKHWATLPIKAEPGFPPIPLFHQLKENEPTAKEITRHILDDLLNLHSHTATYLGVGFTLSAAIQKYFPPEISEISPSLYHVGLTSKGKTEWLKSLQSFYGMFKEMLNWQNTSKHTMSNVHAFKDMTVFIDDFKQQLASSKSVIAFIQLAYSRGQRGTLTQKGENKRTLPAEGLFLMGGEDVFQGEPSAKSRTIVIDTNRHFKKHEENASEFREVQELRQFYSAITPVFIRFAMNFDKRVIEEWSKTFRSTAKSKIEKPTDHTERCLNNFSLPYIGMKMFFLMCKDHLKIIDRKEYLKHIQILEDVCIECLRSMFNFLDDDRPSTSFINAIQAIIFSKDKKFYIDGLMKPGPFAEKIGWVCEDHQSINIMNTAFSLIKYEFKDSITQNLKTVGESLLAEGKLARTTPSESPYFRTRFRREAEDGRKIQGQVLSIRCDAIFTPEIEGVGDIFDKLND